MGSLPKEAGGNGWDGLAYSCWQNVRHLPGDPALEYALLADNIWPWRTVSGGLPLYRVHALSLLARAAAQIGSCTRLARDPLVRATGRSLAKALWYTVVIRAWRPDLIHVHGALRPALVAGSRVGAQLLTTLHGPLRRAPDCPPRRAQAWETRALEVSDCLVTVSERTFHQLYGAEAFHKPRKVIVNGVDPGVLNLGVVPINFGANKCTLLTVGSLTKLKNQTAVVRALVQSGCPERFRYVTIGDGPLREELAALSRQGGVEYQNFPAVPYAQLGAYYRGADFHILLSLTDGFAMCVAESLACGTPVILSNTMDIAFEPTIVKPHNSVRVNLESEIDVGDVLRRIALGEVAFSRSAINYPYSWTCVGQQYAALYRELLGITS